MDSAAPFPSLRSLRPPVCGTDYDVVAPRLLGPCTFFSPLHSGSHIGLLAIEYVTHIALGIDLHT